MACFSRKRKGKGKLSDLPEEAEEGELMAPIPFASPPKQFGKKSGASASIGVKNERVVENAEMRHSWFAWFVCERDEDGCRRLYWTPGTEQGRAPHSSRGGLRLRKRTLGPLKRPRVRDPNEGECNKLSVRGLGCGMNGFVDSRS
ncbi:hypothetical protein R1sor_011444 [Riccia sorocarpa]|uniref:Uncharacterized protein n=1 Tax=Riccia sorocarpa TaxID=122646 RepID=A0ABD3I0Z6_9MARC